MEQIEKYWEKKILLPRIPFICIMFFIVFYYIFFIIRIFILSLDNNQSLILIVFYCYFVHFQIGLCVCLLLFIFLHFNFYFKKYYRMYNVELKQLVHIIEVALLSKGISFNTISSYLISWGIPYNNMITFKITNGSGYIFVCGKNVSTIVLIGPINKKNSIYIDWLKKIIQEEINTHLPR